MSRKAKQGAVYHGEGSVKMSRDEEFLRVCSRYNINPTHRQSRKLVHKRGLLYRAQMEVVE